MKVNPIIKYVGGKTDLLIPIFGKFQNKINTYYEPFIGGGSVLLNLLCCLEENKISVKKIKVNDINPVLIAMYVNIKNNYYKYLETLDQLIKNYNDSPNIEYEKRYKFDKINDKSLKLDWFIKAGKSYLYYYYRKIYNETNDLFLKSVLFLFLNKTCFRGLYRESKNGFNVPFGNYISPNFYDLDNIKNINILFNKYNVEFYNCDFEIFLSSLDYNDFVYCDPPYHDTFTKYNECDFNENKQKNLCNILKNSKTKFVLSNSNTKFINEIYSEFQKELINAKRRINSKNPESVVNELIIYN